MNPKTINFHYSSRGYHQMNKLKSQKYAYFCKRKTLDSFNCQRVSGYAKHTTFTRRNISTWDNLVLVDRYNLIKYIYIELYSRQEKEETGRGLFFLRCWSNSAEQRKS